MQEKTRWILWLSKEDIHSHKALVVVVVILLLSSSSRDKGSAGISRVDSSSDTVMVTSFLCTLAMLLDFEHSFYVTNEKSFSLAIGTLVQMSCLRRFVYDAVHQFVFLGIVPDVNVVQFFWYEFCYACL